MLRVVFDTVVFVRCLINPHGLWGKLVFGQSHAYRLVLSPPVIEETLEVLARPELTAKFRSIAGLDMRAVIDLLTRAEIVDPAAFPSIARDPKDDKFLATAHAASADYLVTEDQDLLVLREYESVRIISAEAFLRILSRQQRVTGPMYP